MPVIIDTLINDKNWQKQDPKIESFIENLILKILPQTKLSKLIDKVEIEISILLTNDNEIQNLNKNYRQKDKATNVLSFPTFLKEDFDNINPKIDDFIAIGDIILSFETLKNEAKEQSKIFEHHLSHLVVHSILHLMGYDHENEKDANIMEQLEIDILKTLAIDNPYSNL